MSQQNLKIFLLFLLGLKVTATVQFTSESVIVSVIWDAESNNYHILNGTVDERVAWANFTNQIDTNGWSFLKVVTNESYPDAAQAYAAGLAEGYVTTDLLYLQWMNTVDGYCEDTPDDYCDRLHDYLNDNKQWMKQQTVQFGKTDAYWHQVDLILQQLQGIQDGYQNPFPVKLKKSVVSDFGFLFFNLGGDLEDLEQALNKSSDLKRKLGSGSCSALIKLLPDNSDLLVAHTTWTSYQTMLRILKKYELNVHEVDAPGSPLIAGGKVSFSSYPGSVYSMDDFYTVASGLTILETTIGNFNASLWKYVTPQTILEFMRNVIANRLATTGQMWTTLFLKYNSGTYNNQWMVVDYKKFLPGQKTLKNGLLWIAEQIPGYAVAQDMTDTLRKQSFWPSYNSPYFRDIYELSGTAAEAEKYGDFFSYDRAPRALIFKRDVDKVVDLESMRKLMRYNDYENDPFSRCNCTPPYSAENGIAARSDLNPVNGTYEIPALGHRSHGATDLKVTSYSLFGNLQFQASSGPTFDTQPPFQWSTYVDESGVTPPHLGHPDLWNFTSIITQWE